MEQELDLGGLGGENLVLRGEVPQFALERPDCLLAGRVHELLVGLIRLPLVERVLETPGLDLGVHFSRERVVLVEGVLESGGEMDLGRLDVTERVEHVLRQRGRAVLHRAGELVLRPGYRSESQMNVEVHRHARD